MQNLRYPYPFLPVSGDVIDATSSTLNFSDLYDLAGSVNVGIYDVDTQAIATGTGNGKKFFIGYSSIHTKDKLDTFIFGVKNPMGHPYWAFKGTDVLSFEYSDSLMPKSEVWALGYSGSDGCNLQLPTFKCDKMYGVRIILKSNAITKLIGHNQTYDIFSDIVCCNSDECVTGCSDDNVDCERILKQIAERINTSQPSKMVNLKARYITNTYTAPGVFALTIYRVNLIDDGSNTAQAFVQQHVPAGTTVSRVNRVGLVSTYEVCAASAPTNLSAPVRFAIPTDCLECPTGSTLVEAQREYLVTRPLMEDDEISDGTEQAAYATAIATAYKTVLTKTFNGTVAGVNVTDDEITLTAHGFSTGDKVTYTNGGGTSITGLTSGNDYYVIVVDANTIKLATTANNAFNGTDIDLTVVGVGTAHTLAPVITGTFVSHLGGAAMVRLTTSGSRTLAAFDADIVVLAVERSIHCTLPNGATPETWSSVGTAYRATRTLCITLPRTKCEDGDRLTELAAYYNTTRFPSIVADSLEIVEGDACEDSYTIDQYSEGCMTDACLASDTAVFADLGGYDGQTWTLVEGEAPAYDADKRCGLLFTAEFTPEFLDECEFELGMDTTPDPVEFEVSWIVDEATGEAGEVCNFKALRGKKLESAVYPRQSGYGVLNRYIQSAVYEPFGGDYCHPTLRRVLDSNLRKQVDRTNYYRYYYLTFKVDRNNTNFDQKSEVVEATFVVPNDRPDKMKKLELAILSPLSKFGVTLQKRIDG